MITLKDYPEPEHPPLMKRSTIIVVQPVKTVTIRR